LTKHHPPKCRLLLVEGDPFARYWIERCVRADQNFKLAGSLSDTNDIFRMIHIQSVDLLILNCELVEHPYWTEHLAHSLHSSPKTRVVYTCVHPDLNLFIDLYTPFFQGYLLKSEIDGDPTRALHHAMKGYWVMTTSICAMAYRKGFFPNNPFEVSTRSLNRLQENNE
jgi:DNA-binding NarL/FixJ family response regulator